MASSRPLIVPSMPLTELILLSTMPSVTGELFPAKSIVAPFMVKSVSSLAMISVSPVKLSTPETTALFMLKATDSSPLIS